MQHAGKIEVLLIIGIICFAIGLPAFCVEPLVFISCLGKAHPPTLCNESESGDEIPPASVSCKLEKSDMARRVRDLVEPMGLFIGY